MAIVNDPHPLTLKHLREWAVEDDIAATMKINTQPDGDTKRQSESRLSWRDRVADFLKKLLSKNKDTTSSPTLPIATESPGADYAALQFPDRTISKRTRPSNNTYYSALSRASQSSAHIKPGYLQQDDEYALLLQSRKLWPVDPRIEQDWSDRGQHAIFQDDEQSLIDKILQVKDNLGSTRTAVVQSVQCRRILLARKTIKCGRQTMTKEEAIAEVSHLTRLNHAHILRLIGTYVKGRDLSILLYPVASYNLEEFLYDVQHTLHCSIFWLRAQSSIEQFFPCLSSAVRYIHENLTKHMDIKPQNILVETRGNITYRPYIADFGIARVYNTLEDVETNGRTSFTKRYAAPEVVRQDTRGLTADIFSLGCVFLELGDSLYPDVPELRGVKEQWKDASYQANINTLQALIARYIQGTSNRFAKVTFFAISQMIQLEPLGRPTAEQLHCVWKQNDCCIAGSVPLEAMPRPL